MTGSAEPSASSETRTRILDAVLDLLSAQMLRSLSLEDVATRSAVSRQTVYRHFGSRDGLLRAVVIREEGRLAERARSAVVGVSHLDQAVCVAVTALLEGVREHPLFDRLLSEDPETMLPYLTLGGGPVLATSTAIVADLVRDFVPTDDNQVALISDVLSRLVISYTIAPGERSPRDVGEIATRVVRGGLLGSIRAEKPASRG